MPKFEGHIAEILDRRVWFTVEAEDKEEAELKARAGAADDYCQVDFSEEIREVVVLDCEEVTVGQDAEREG